MNFLLSEEQLALVDTVKALLRDKCDPVRVHKMFDVEGDAQFDAELWAALCEMGIPAIMVPEAHGGLGLELIDLAIVAEVLGHAAAPVPFLGHVLAALAISLAGSDEQKAAWLPRLASGEVLGTVAFGEGKSAWLPHEWQLSATGGLSGVKTLVPNAAEADLIVVGVSEGLALVEKGAAYTSARIDSADRTRPVDTVTFEGAAAELLPQGKETSSRLTDAAAALIAADAFGGRSAACRCRSTMPGCASSTASRSPDSRACATSWSRWRSARNPRAGSTGSERTPGTPCPTRLPTPPLRPRRTSPKPTCKSRATRLRRMAGSASPGSTIRIST